jgi:hypothetical protein
MPKGILEFDLNDSEDRRDFDRVNKSLDMALALWEILHNTKKKMQWDVEQRNISSDEALDLVWDKLWEIVNERNINIDELIQ